MYELQSYLQDSWVRGTGPATNLLNPATEAVVANTCTRDLDMAAALSHARTVGGPALRAMTFAERGAMLRQLAEAIVSHRKELLTLSTINNGATRSDSKFDIDGASFTLQAYAELGESLGDKCWLVEGETIELARSKRFAGIHIKTPRLGAAVHINAFNFPAWGMAEKLAVAFLAGMPVLTKPATSTALTAWRLAEVFVGAGVMPPGAFSIVSGSAGDLVDRLEFGDVLAFTGSSGLGQRFKAAKNLVAGGVPVNVEADSLNAAVLGPDVEADSETFELAMRDIFRDMTQKTGQKCTAIRRVLVPESLLDAATESLVASAKGLKIGDPQADNVRMGPVVTASQRDDVLEGLAKLAETTQRVVGSGQPESVIRTADGGDGGFFVDVHLFRAENPAASMAADIVHDREVFGPAATLLPYDGSATQAAALLARGRGGLVASVYTDDRAFSREMILGAAPYHGRLNLGSEKVAEYAPGPGTVMPQLVHGGPGRAGGGEELGMERGLDLYLQRTAVQGYKPLLDKMLDGK